MGSALRPLLGNSSGKHVSIIGAVFSVWSVPRLYSEIPRITNTYKIMITTLFAPLDKAKPVTENIRGLNLAAVKHTTIQATRQPL
jgi:hypothetical protein